MDTLKHLPENINNFLNNCKWRPGLIEVAIKGKVTDALGLGDIVFPAILTSWALRFDMANKRMNIQTINDILPSDTTSSIDKTDNKNENSLYKSCLMGYVVGCILCDVSMATGTNSNGIPALLYLVPSMFASIAISGVINNNWSKLLAYNSTDDSLIIK